MHHFIKHDNVVSCWHAYEQLFVHTDFPLGFVGSPKNYVEKLTSYFSKIKYNVIIRCKILVCHYDEYEYHNLSECDAVQFRRTVLLSG